jgi:hypothetical protein
MGFVFLWNESSGIQVGEGMALLFGSNALHSILIIFSFIPARIFAFLAGRVQHAASASTH